MPPTHGGYSLVVEPRFVEPIARVRFSLAAQNAGPLLGSFAVWAARGASVFRLEKQEQESKRLPALL